MGPHDRTVAVVPAAHPRRERQCEGIGRSGGEGQCDTNGESDQKLAHRRGSICLRGTGITMIS